MNYDPHEANDAPVPPPPYDRARQAQMSPPPTLMTCPGSERSPRTTGGSLYRCSCCAAVFLHVPGTEPPTAVPVHGQRMRLSATYVPRIDHYMNEPLLHAAAAQGLPEEVVIDLLMARMADLERSLNRALSVAPIGPMRGPVPASPESTP